jgi:hypothetical protein
MDADGEKNFDVGSCEETKHRQKKIIAFYLRESAFICG